MSVIPIYFASNDSYCKYLSVAIISLLENTKSNIEINVLDSGICNKNKTLLNKIAKQQINYIDVKDKLKIFNRKYKKKDNLFISTDTFSRFFINDDRKIIYSDVDVIFNNDILLMYEQNLDNKPIGAVPEDSSVNYFNNYITKSISKIKLRFFSSGNLLIDGQKYKSICKKSIKLFLDNKKIKNDIYAINIAVNNNYKPLDNRFCQFSTNGTFFELEKANEIVIFHYTYTKPWENHINSYTHEHAVFLEKLFFHYAKKSFFYKEIKKTFYKNIIKSKLGLRKKAFLHIKNVARIDNKLIKIQKNSKIAIIIPIYNVEKYLKECLDSIKKQTYKNFLCICINDGSTDNSKSIAEKYTKKDKRFILINQKNYGLGGARNTGIKKALELKIPYISCVDSDDFVSRNYLEFLYKGILSGNYNMCRAKHYTIDKFNFLYHTEKMISDDLILNYNNKRLENSAWGCLFETNLFSEFSHLEYDYMQYKKSIAEDARLNTLVATKNNVNLINLQNHLYFYRLRKSGLMSKFINANLKNNIYENYVENTKKYILEPLAIFNNNKIYKNELIKTVDRYLLHESKAITLYLLSLSHIEIPYKNKKVLFKEVKSTFKKLQESDLWKKTKIITEKDKKMIKRINIFGLNTYIFSVRLNKARKQIYRLIKQILITVKRIFLKKFNKKYDKVSRNWQKYYYE